RAEVELRKHEVHRVELAVTMEGDEEHGRQQPGRAASAGPPEVRAAGDEPGNAPRGAMRDRRLTRRPAHCDWASIAQAARPTYRDANARPSRYCFSMARPVTVASVLCANRTPHTPSVDLSFPAATSSDLG